MNFFKRNKNIILALIIFFGGLVVGVQVKRILFPDNRAPVYGNRLDGKVPVQENISKIIKEKINDGVTKVNVRVSGRIINVEIEVLEEVSRDAAKRYGEIALEQFKKEKEFYDFQIMITKAGESKEFPIIGYKSLQSSYISWTKDR